MVHELSVWIMVVLFPLDLTLCIVAFSYEMMSNDAFRLFTFITSVFHTIFAALCMLELFAKIPKYIHRVVKDAFDDSVRRALMEREEESHKELRGV